MPASSKKSAYLSDHWTTQDHLHFGDFRPALLEILLEASTPLTVGVFGPWGSGKTSLMHMLKADIDAKGFPFTRTVWFTAWKYDRHEALWRAFTLRVIDGLYPQADGKRIPLDQLKDETQRQQVQMLDRMVPSLYRTVTWEEQGGWSLDLGVTAKETIKLPISLILRLAGQGEIAKEYGLDPKLAEIIQREVQEQRLEQLASMEQFEAAFENTLETVLGEKGRLVVFVDDLDRCLPEKAIEVLEAIKLFLNVPRTVFVLGMDRGVVERGVESHYGIFLKKAGEEVGELPISGSIYLQKLVQIPFHLPPLGLDDLQTFLQELEQDLPGEARLEEMTRQVFCHGLFPNPRQAKRAVNVFRLLQEIALTSEARGGLPKDAIAWPLLAKTVLIQSQWPELYALWRQYPTLVRTLEAEYRSRPTSDDELIRGWQERRQASAPQKDEEAKEIKEDIQAQAEASTRPESGGLLGPFLRERHTYARLAEMLTYPEEPGVDRQRALFAGLSRAEMSAYLSLVGSVEAAELETPIVEAPGDLLEGLLSGDAVLVEDALAQLEAREEEGKGPLSKALLVRLQHVVEDERRPEPLQAIHAADALDRLGWLPLDLHEFVLIPPDESGLSYPFYIARYPLTNAQYARFLAAEDYADSDLWMGFPRFDEESQSMDGDWGAAGWEWYQKPPDNREKSPSGVIYPRFWDDPNFGLARRGAPVVGVSWYEANAYCKWLLRHWQDVDFAERLANPDLKPVVVRLPTESEWLAAAGGDKPPERYPWDAPKVSTQDEDEITRRANVSEAGIGRTTPVGAYPLGVRQPQGLWDLAGNVWEWQANYRSVENNRLALRGGSWFRPMSDARPAARSHGSNPHLSNGSLGFRVLLLPSM